MYWIIIFIITMGLVMWSLFRDENPLDQLPGPRRIPFIGCPLVYAFIDTRQMFIQVRKFFKQYGDRHLIKIFHRRILHISNPNDVEAVLSHTKNITKSMPYSFLQPWLGTGLLLSTGEKWHNRRKILTPTFHFNILNNFSVVMQEKTKNLIDRLKRSSSSDVNVMQEISDLTLFIICETAMGIQLDKDKSANTMEYKSAVHDIGKLIVSRLMQWWLHSDFMFNLSSQKKRYDECLRKGHDTTSTTLTYLLMLLADHEEVQDRIYEECRAILGETNRPSGMSDWAEMKYLDAVIKESLRLYPGAPYIGRSVTEDFMMGDLLVKKGTSIAVHIYDLHRREDMYPEAAQFRPERFLNPDTRRPYAYVPFSAGPRNCIGQKFARLEMKCIISELCRSFRLRPKVRGTIPEMASDLVLRPLTPVYVQFIPR